jgi:hypothetical protein
MKLLRCCTLVALACIAGDAQADNKDFDVEFAECGEYVGIGYVPFERARGLVPAEYTLARDGDNAVIVVRVANCDSVAVNGGNSRSARTAQIGISLAAAEPAADIDNYLLWYVTDLGPLHAKLGAAGIKNGNDQQLAFVFEAAGGTGPLSIDVDAPQFPAYPLEGEATPPTGDPVRFTANWWSEGRHGTVLMRSVFPQIRFSGASVTLTTSPDSELAALIGAESLQFAILDSYNEFETALMEVRLQ